jgi:hypothetical protein
MPARRTIDGIGHRAAMATLCLLLAWPPAPAPAQSVQSVFPDPGLLNPKLRFHTGGTANGQSEIAPDLPEIPGEASAWVVVQWKKRDLLKPSRMRRNDVASADLALGAPAYTFGSASGESKVSIFLRSGGGPVFELRSTGGWLDDVGGSNLFLQTRAALPNATFDAALDYSVNLKLPAASAQAPNPLALRNGAVLAQVVSGFSIAFTDPDSKRTIPLFLQIVHADSRGTAADYRGCYPHGGGIEIVSSRILPGDPQLPFAASTGAPLSARYNLNRYLCDVLARGFQCKRGDGSSFPLEFPVAARDFRNWRLTAMFVGLETHDTDLRRSAWIKSKQGDVTVALQVSGLGVTRDGTRPFDGRSCPAK